MRDDILLGSEVMGWLMRELAGSCHGMDGSNYRIVLQGGEAWLKLTTRLNE